MDSIHPFLNHQAFEDVLSNVDDLYRSQIVYPPKEHVFKALELSSFEATKVVIVGQDPYHGDGQAHGLSFSVPDGVMVPPSLRNIFKELNRSLKCTLSSSGNLTPWAKQGVLLLNSHLTVEAGKAGSHAKLGWDVFTNALLEALSKKGDVVFLLWGKHAIDRSKMIDSTHNLILTAPHPSPLSAHRGFIGCNHFVLANDYLMKTNQNPIDWCNLELDLFSNINQPNG